MRTVVLFAECCSIVAAIVLMTCGLTFMVDAWGFDQSSVQALSVHLKAIALFCASLTFMKFMDWTELARDRLSGGHERRILEAMILLEQHAVTLEEHKRKARAREAKEEVVETIDDIDT